MTVLTIAHRLQTIIDADKIVSDLALLKLVKKLIFYFALSDGPGRRKHREYIIHLYTSVCLTAVQGRVRVTCRTVG